MRRRAGMEGSRALRWFVLALFAIPASAVAQDPLGTPQRERAGDLRIRVLGTRAELGVVLGPAEQVDGRTGVRVLRVVPDRPAERAGIRADDVLLSINGAPVGDEPGRQVRERMAGVEPGDTVVVVLRRDGTDRTVHVVAERGGFAFAPGAVRLGPDVVLPGFERGVGVAEALRGLRPAFGPLGRHRLELAAMNPRLGRYFGAEDGVLVVDVADGSTLGLQPGDVIVTIGGRTVRDAAHARSILASYRGDEPVELEVIRDRRRVTVRGTAGDAS